MADAYVRPTREEDPEFLKKLDLQRQQDDLFDNICKRFQQRVSHELLSGLQQGLQQLQRQIEATDDPDEAESLLRDLRVKRELFNMGQAEIRRLNKSHQKAVTKIQGQSENRSIQRNLETSSVLEAEVKAKRDGKSTRSLYVSMIKNILSSSPNPKLLKAYEGYMQSSVGTSEREQYLGQIYYLLNEGL